MLALEIDLAAQHSVIGYIETERRRLSEATAALDTALRLDPDFADAYALLGGVRTYAAVPGETVPLLRKAIRRRPDGGFLYFLLLGRAYCFLDDCDQAMINLREAVQRNPANLETNVYMANCLVRLGARDGAEWEALENRAIDPGFTISGFFDTYPMTANGQIETLPTDLKGAGVD